MPFLLWLCLTLRIFFFYLSTSIVMTPLQFAWNNSARRLARLVPERLRIIVAAILTILVIIVGAFASPESQDNTRANRAVSLFGLAVLLLLLWATSRNRRAIQWHTVITGMLLQFIVALFVLRTKTG